jgi:hypothetical protein
MTEELIHELETLFRDFGVSPRGKGRRFPDPVKSRLISLLQSGIGAWDLSRATGISLTTLFAWRDKSAIKNFERIEIKPAQTTVTRLYLGEKAWIELDLETLSVEALQKIRACL